MFFLVVVCLWIQFAVTGVCASALPDWCLANRPTAGDFVLSGNCVLNSTELVILRNQTNILAIQGTQRTELLSNSQPERCPICQAGSYSSTINALTCTTCEAGKASSVVGAKRADACQECKAGQYASYIGGTSCTLCATGKSSSIVGAKGPSTCVDCLPGTFSALQGQGMCAVCPVNTISPLGNAMSCDKCPFGKYANPNRTTCNFCKGAPLCYGHGTCDTHKSKCVCFNVDLNGNPTGWTGDACNQCAAQWSSADGKCNSCAHGYKMTRRWVCDFALL